MTSDASTRAAAPEGEMEPSPMDAPMLGVRIEIFWPDDDQWYAAEVLAFDRATLLHNLRYELDDVEEWLDLLQNEWRPQPYLHSEIELLSRSTPAGHTRGGGDGSDGELEDLWEAPRRCEVRSFDEPSLTHLLRYTDEGTDDEYVDLRFCLWRSTGKFYRTPHAVSRLMMMAATTPKLAAAAGEEEGEAEYQPSFALKSDAQRLAVASYASSNPPTEAPLGTLEDYVVKYGGTIHALSGWRCLKYERGVAGGFRRGNGSGTHYFVFVSPGGDKFRSKREVARALGLAVDVPPVSSSVPTPVTASSEPPAVKSSAPTAVPSSADSAKQLSQAERKQTKRPLADSEPPADEPLLCSRVAEVDGGLFCCSLPAFHVGPHKLEEPPKRPRPTFGRQGTLIKGTSAQRP